MRHLSHLLLFPKKIQFLILFLGYTCLIFAQTSTVTYTESTEDFMNPDRGFYYPIVTNVSSFTALDYNALLSLRNTAFTPYQGNYNVRTSLIFRHYILDNAVTSSLTSTFLSQVQTDFDIARSAGVRLILRFSYTITPDDSCGETACPPYGDATKARVLEHISQLKPVLQNNEDVIATVQTGFIGIWGEQYYTDYFGDPSSQGDGRILDARWQDRIDMLDSLLRAVPTTRMIQVRYPQIKQKYVYGIAAPVSSAAMTASQAHNGSDISRIAFHNDCFLAASDDFGTYWDYGSSSTFPSDQTTILKPYSEADGNFLVVGGETCSDGFSPENDCAGQAVSDMESLHYSFLNADYNNDVNNDWQTDGCMDEIRRRLGYRFVMSNGTYPNTATVGNTVSFTLNLENVGFAAPYNERTLQMVLRNTSTNAEYKTNISATNSDTRFWDTGNIILNGSFNLPSNLAIGDYELFLHLLDPSNNNAIANRPEYSIQMANQNVWETTTGYNKLNHTLTVLSNDCISIDGNLDDWTTMNTIATNGTGGFTNLKAADNSTQLYIQAAGNTDVNYQMYLDTDNDATGSNEYLNTAWSATGFNFMIENGIVYAYTGTGTDWSWNQVGTANAVKNNLGLELAIEKSLLTGMTVDMKIAIASLNASWAEVGQIPLTNTAADYANTSSINCGCMSSDLLLAGSQAVAQNYETDGEITSTQTFSGDIVVTYDAQVSIFLNPGFSTAGTSDFRAYLEGCTNAALVLEDEEDTEEVFVIQKEASKNKVSVSRLSVFPNPFQAELNLNYELQKAAKVSMTIYNVFGKAMTPPFVNKWEAAGNYSVAVNAGEWSEGIYFVVMQVGEEVVVSERVVLSY